MALRPGAAGRRRRTPDSAVRGAVAPGDLGDRYLTACDPRLNAAQAVEVAAVAAHEFG
ncbi:3-deoxy-7-phosphoheptulonate synthase [Pseudonocardia tropica]|uniref:Phospho-2-dehydro-3-deoxyheptonate aldolase n=1 Tax=Pseudonocardia tropica TaxID=681289 RepID=A0ABV1K0C9_9PSEU